MWDTHCLCETHTAHARHTPPTQDTNCLCETYIAHARHILLMWDTHCPCEAHTAHTRHTHTACLRHTLPTRDKHIACVTHTLPMWDTYCSCKTHCPCETHTAYVRHTAHMRHTLPMRDTHCPSQETLTARVRHTALHERHTLPTQDTHHPCETLPVWDACPCETHLLPMWDTHCRVRQAHTAQSMLCRPAPCPRKHGHSTGPKEPGFAEILWGSKHNLVPATNFLKTPDLDTWAQSWRAKEESLWIFLHAKLQSHML